jgi:threonine dehydratase
VTRTPETPRNGGLQSAAGQTPTLEDVRHARDRIRDVVRHTPLEPSLALSEAWGATVYLKLECWQRTRSFKVRGAYNAIAGLPAARRAAGLVTASAGNHGQAVALAARELGARATVYVPTDAPRTKRDRIRRLGADLRADAVDYDHAERLAREHAERHGAIFVHAFSDPAVIAGQATIALEVIDDLPDVSDIVVPVGGGGLIAGIGLVMRALRPAARVIGVQSVETRAVYEAMRAGAVVDTVVTPTLADGLAGATDDATFQRVRRVMDEIVLVEEADIADAIRALHADDGITVEGSAAVAAAALRTGRLGPRGATVLIMTGGNIDGATLAGILTPRST